MTDPQIQVFPEPDAVARAAAERILTAAREAVLREGAFTLALSGGSTPRRLYEVLAAEPFRSAMPWADTEVFFGDERCVPPDHADSNYRMARESLLSRVPIPPASIHRVQGEIEPVLAAAEYERLIGQRFEDAGLDLCLLGLGDDGHTASIFPGSPAAQEPHRPVLGYFAENSSTGRSWRVTLTAPFINRSAHVLFLVCGAGKARILQEVLEGPRDPLRLPAQLIDPHDGKLTFLVDAAAAGMVEE